MPTRPDRTGFGALFWKAVIRTDANRCDINLGNDRDASMAHPVDFRVAHPIRPDKPMDRPT